MTKKLLTFLTLLTLFTTSAWAAQKTDLLNLTWLGMSGVDYSAWTNKSGSASSAVYAGRNGGGNNSIQINSNSPNGIVSTTSGGKVKKVKITWQENTTDSRCTSYWKLCG